MRSGPGRISTVPVRRVHSLNTIDRLWRSRVGSPFTSMNCAAWVTGSKTITNSAGSCSERIAFSPGRQLDRVEHDLLDQPLEILRQVDARAPEDLAAIFDQRERIRVVGGDPAHARADREGHLDHLVEGRLVARGAERAAVVAPG